MTNSQIFKKAHQIARQTVAIVGNYMIAFSLALKSVYAALASTENRLINAGLRVWENYGKKRIYINGADDLMAAFPGLSINLYKTGNISSAYYKGEKISNNKAVKLAGYGMYFDCIADQWVNATSTAQEILDF